MLLVVDYGIMGYSYGNDNDNFIWEFSDIYM